MKLTDVQIVRTQIRLRYSIENSTEPLYSVFDISGLGITVDTAMQLCDRLFIAIKDAERLAKTK